MKEKKHLKIYKRIGIILLAAIVLFCVVTYIAAPYFMVQPNFDSDSYAKVSQLDCARELYLIFDTENNTVYETDSADESDLSGWYLDSPSSDDLLIFFYGISEDSSYSAMRFESIREEYGYFENVDVVIVDYPGYGKSSGTASDDLLRESAAAVSKYFTQTAEKAYIMGYSMGTGPACYAAGKLGSSCDGLILLAPYYSSVDLYNNVTNVFHGPLKHLLSYNMDTYLYAADVTGKVLMIASKSDQRVPYESSLKLAECFPEKFDFTETSESSYKFITFDGLSHSGLWEDSQVLCSIDSFLAS